jgi:hypothetical protein
MMGCGVKQQGACIRALPLQGAHISRVEGETANKAQGHLDAVNRAKNERLDRHTGTGVRGSPKKGGGGKGGWGSFEDDIKDATKGDVHPNTNPKVDSKIQED